MSIVFAFATHCAAQAKPDFVIETNRPYVYLVFDHMGEGPSFADGEPRARIWFRLVNNCRVPIRLRTFGAPKSAGEPVGSFASKKDVEVGILLNVVKDEEGFRVISDKEPPQSEKDFSKMPIGYVADFSSASTVGPSQSLLFSVPTNFLGENWHIEIPYQFEVPNKCCRPENIGGEPRMVLSYSFWSLPPSTRSKLKTER